MRPRCDDRGYVGRGRVQQVEETLAEAGVLRSRVRRECVECNNAGGWGEGEEGAVEPAAWGGFYRGAVIGVCVETVW